MSVEWLADCRLPQLRVIDATVQVRRLLFAPVVRTGRREWRREHIPGSTFADLFAMSDPARPRRSMTMAAPERLAAALGELGIGDDSRVVVYDRRENMWAARLWWMLRAIGFDEAAILDGGWSAWRQADKPVCSVRCAYAPAHLTPRPRNDLFVDKAAVLAVLGDPHVCLLNALGRRQHRGELNEYGRRGHIPGSRNVTAWEVLDRDTQRYRPLPELRDKLSEVLDHPRVITYCGAGAGACSLAHVLVRLGHPDVSVYDGGLLEWCADPDLPLELGP